MGGVAVSLWKYVRATQDVDLLVAVPNDEDQLIQAFQDAGFLPKRQPPVLQLDEFRLLQLLYEPAGRILDRADVSALLRANEAALDTGYLHTWASRLGVEADLKSIWQESLPGRDGPEGAPGVK